MWKVATIAPNHQNPFLCKSIWKIYDPQRWNIAGRILLTEIEVQNNQFERRIESRQQCHLDQSMKASIHAVSSSFTMTLCVRQSQFWKGAITSSPDQFRSSQDFCEQGGLVPTSRRQNFYLLRATFDGSPKTTNVWPCILKNLDFLKSVELHGRYSTRNQSLIEHIRWFRLLSKSSKSIGKCVRILKSCLQEFHGERFAPHFGSISGNEHSLDLSGKLLCVASMLSPWENAANVNFDEGGIALNLRITLIF